MPAMVSRLTAPDTGRVLLSAAEDFQPKDWTGVGVGHRAGLRQRSVVPNPPLWPAAEQPESSATKREDRRGKPSRVTDLAVTPPPIRFTTRHKVAEAYKYDNVEKFGVRCATLHSYSQTIWNAITKTYYSVAAAALFLSTAALGNPPNPPDYEGSCLIHYAMGPHQQSARLRTLHR